MFYIGILGYSNIVGVVSSLGTESNNFVNISGYTILDLHKVKLSMIS